MSSKYDGHTCNTVARTRNVNDNVYANKAFRFEIILILEAIKFILAHLSHRFRVSYCHRPMSVVRCATSVVRRQQFVLNDNYFETAWPRALIFGM